MSEKSRTLSIGEALDEGIGYAMAGNHKSAVTMFRGVLVHESENFEAIERLGASLFEQRQYYEALYWFWRGIKINRRHPQSLTHYGLCISQLGHHEEALEYLRLATFHAEKEGVPSNVKALVYNNLGNTLLRLNRYKEALEVLDKGLAYNPRDPFPHYNRGIALLKLNRHYEAISALDRSLELRPATDADAGSRLERADALYNRGVARLLMGDLKEGFPDYEARLITSENKTPNFNLPADKQWQGESLEGKRLLIHGEQGLGDTIMFFRFLPAVMGRCDRMHLIVHSAMRPFAEAIPGITVSGGGEPIPEYDYWVGLLSLANRLGVEKESDIPPPFLPRGVYPEKLSYYSTELPQGLRVAVCWAGNFQHKNDAHRSIPLEQFATIFDAPCAFVSVQQMQQADTAIWPDLVRGRPVTALWLDDLRDTAAALLNCDLVVSADTAVAHLAATLGIPTWVLIPAFGTDWRWQLRREDSPWYRTARLIRQDKIGDWRPTLAQVRHDLMRMAATRDAA